MADRLDIILDVNDANHRVRVEARKTLLDAIREDCGLTGTHAGCEHGVCGCCTVLLDGEPVRACLMFAVQAEGRKVQTVEGLADGDVLHPLQAAFIRNHALQCGYCTPGFLMLIAGAMERKDLTDEEELVDLLSSNLCRCTGYANIAKAVREVVRERAQQTSHQPARSSLTQGPDGS